jgi:hypothetical protein
MCIIIHKPLGHTGFCYKFEKTFVYAPSASKILLTSKVVKNDAKTVILLKLPKFWRMASYTRFYKKIIIFYFFIQLKILDDYINFVLLQTFCEIASQNSPLHSAMAVSLIYHRNHQGFYLRTLNFPSEKCSPRKKNKNCIVYSGVDG